VKRGKSVFHPVCGVKFVKNDEGVSRFAVVVGKKVDKSAVVRNKVKRQYREIVRKRLGMIKAGYDVVLLTSKKAIDVSYPDKDEAFEVVLRKAGLL